jgi:hypothetical protein
MSDDEKVSFYLKYRAEIEEWKQLRGPASAALDAAIEGALRSLRDDPDVPEPTFKEGRYRYSHLGVTEDPRLWIELNWDTGLLLADGGNWPTLIVGGRLEKGPIREAVLAATQLAVFDYGMRKTSGSGAVWLRYGQVVPDSEPIELLDYAQHCVDRLRSAWLDLHGPMRAAVS